MYIRMELRGDDDLSVCLSSRSDAISILLSCVSHPFHFISSFLRISAQLCRFPFVLFFFFFPFRSSFFYVQLWNLSVFPFVLFIVVLGACNLLRISTHRIVDKFACCRSLLRVSPWLLRTSFATDGMLSTGNVLLLGELAQLAQS